MCITGTLCTYVVPLRHSLVRLKALCNYSHAYKKAPEFPPGLLLGECYSKQWSYRQVSKPYLIFTGPSSTLLRFT